MLDLDAFQFLFRGRIAGNSMFPGLPGASGFPEISIPPVESEAPESTEGSAHGDEPVESLAADAGPAGGPLPIDPMLWPWIGAVAALAAALIAALIALAVQRKKCGNDPGRGNAVPPEGFPMEQLVQPAQFAQPIQPVLPGTVPQVGKLHRQGARPSQQDCFSVSPAEFIPSLGLLAVVADGMGGLTDGDKVSQTAVAAIMNGFYAARGQPEEVLLTLLGLANSEVNRLLGPDGCGKSGSTLVAGLVRDGRFYTLSVGDSRVCLYRDGTLYQLNREHIFLHELEQRAVNGEDSLQAAYSHPRRAGLTSYLGMGRLRYVDMPAGPIDIHIGDKFLLMSDGVYNALAQAELTACLSAPAEEAAVLLEQAIRAKNYSNQDNYTAVILGF